jgi:hypothetical protein
MKTTGLEPTYIYHQSKLKQMTDEPSSYIRTMQDIGQEQKHILGNIADHLFLRMKAGEGAQHMSSSFWMIGSKDLSCQSKVGEKTEKKRRPRTRALSSPGWCSLTRVRFLACLYYPIF